MINYWWVTRPKRKLNSVPEVLSRVAEVSLNQQWQGQRGTHLELEEALEKAGLKRKGERRDQTGGGGRTYFAWMTSLGLVFEQQSTGRIMLTLAGEALINESSPVEILKNQVLKYQFPSSFSISRGVCVSPRFHIRPFRFLLRLLMDSRIQYLTQEEIAKIVAVEAENETDACFEHVVQRLLEFRNSGDRCLAADFFTRYAPSRQAVNPAHPFSHLLDLANTLINWLDYTQLIARESGGIIRVLDEKRQEVEAILSAVPPFIDRPEDHEYFQRRYGLDPGHRKDTRDLTGSLVVTPQMIALRQIQTAFIRESLHRPIAKITPDLVDLIAETTGFRESLVEETLQREYPAGAVGGFLAEYFEMAFKGKEDARNFELATAALFRDVFGFQAIHVGPQGLTPDVLIIPDSGDWQAIIDNKAYSRYTISNDHRNRMIHNYIPGVDGYSSSQAPLSFFTYIAGGFGSNFESQLQSVVRESGIHGSGISVSSMISLIRASTEKGVSQEDIRRIFSVDRQILNRDFL